MSGAKTGAKSQQPEEKTEEQLEKERFNDPNKTDEQREAERRQGQKIPDPETPEEKGKRLAEEKKAEKGLTRVETEEQKLAREGKEENVMREKGGTMIREVKEAPRDALGTPQVSIRPLVPPTKDDETKKQNEGAVKEKSAGDEAHKVKK